MPANQTREGNPRELHILTEVAKTLTAHLDLRELLDTVMQKIEEVIDPAEFGVIFIWNPSEGVFRPHAACGQSVRDLKALYGMVLDDGEAITGQVYREGRAYYWGAPDEIERAQVSLQPGNRALLAQALGPAPPRSLISAPLSAGAHRYGVLHLGSLSGPAIFTQDDLPFVQTLADLIALAIDRSRLDNEAAAIRDARRSEWLRAEALATLSHELRTPLAAIKGYSSALLLDEISWPIEKQQEFLRLIEEECDNLQTMINDILDSSLIDIGQMALAFQPVRLKNLAREVAEEMQRRTEAHRLVVDFPSDFPIVDADPMRIKQVLRNIIDNAIKYSPAGGLVVIRGEIRSKDVVVSISDQGVGISPEDLIPLFEKYFRVKSPTGYHVPGTGLGLPVARSIVEAHHGRIWAESQVQQGTTLYFSVPRVRESEEVTAGPPRSG